MLALVVATAGAGCAAEAGSGDAVGQAEGEIGETPKSAGITEGSLQEEGVLLLVNDRAVTEDTLTSRTDLSAPVAKSITAFRTGADGKPRWFSSIDEIDALPETTTSVFERLVADATANGYVEPADLIEPRVALAIPPNLGRLPTEKEVIVEGGFDGKTPQEAVAIVRSRLTNTVHSSNERFVTQTITDNHKAFTLALNNFFVFVSKHRIFASQLNADKLSVIGTMSALHPTYLIAEKAGVTTYYTRGERGVYEAVAKPTYPVIMRARIRIINSGAPGQPPAGVRVFYPAWSAKVLAGPTSEIIEGSH